MYPYTSSKWGYNKLLRTEGLLTTKEFATRVIGEIMVANVITAFSGRNPVGCISALLRCRSGA